MKLKPTLVIALAIAATVGAGLAFRHNPATDDSISDHPETAIPESPPPDSAGALTPTEQTPVEPENTTPGTDGTDKPLSELVMDPEYANELVHTLLQEFGRDRIIGSYEDLREAFPDPRDIERLDGYHAEGHALFCAFGNGCGLAGVRVPEDATDYQKGLLEDVLVIDSKKMYLTMAWQVEQAQDDPTLRFSNREEAIKFLKDAGFEGYRTLYVAPGAWGVANFRSLTTTPAYKALEEERDQKRKAYIRDAQGKKLATMISCPYNHNRFLGKR